MQIRKARLLKSRIRGGLMAVLLLAVAPSSATEGQNQGGVTMTPSTPPDQLLLKDYRPRSLFKVPQTRVEKARFPIIDMHSHPYARTPAQVDQWVRNMDAVG